MNEPKKELPPEKYHDVRRVAPPTPDFTPAVPDSSRGVIVRAAPLEREGRNYKIVLVDTKAYLVPSEEVPGSRGQEVTVVIANTSKICYDFAEEISSLSIPPDIADRLRHTFWRNGGVTKDDVMRDDIRGVLRTILPTIK